jgi:hypothetical protein
VERLTLHISNNSVASAFQAMQTLAGPSGSGDDFASQLTGQNLPTSGARGATASQGASPLSTAPSSPFATSILSALLAAQEEPPLPQTLASSIGPAVPAGGG